MEELCVPKALPRTENGVMLGIFQPNMYANQFQTAAAGLSHATYQVNRNVIKLADEMGLSFALTVGRWKGVPGDSTGYATYGFDTYTLVGAMLEATERITIISTTHTAIWNPVIAAKMGADLDQIGRGRWGLNIVAGWNEDEFRSMNVPLLDHEERYVQATEWLAAARELWTVGESSYQGKHIKLDGAECHPRPMQQGGPVVVNAGLSPTGMKFALDNADYLFSAFATDAQFQQVRQEFQSNVGYIGMKRIVLGKTDAEAADRANEIVERADLLALVRGPYTRLLNPENVPMSEQEVRAKIAADPSLVRKVLLAGTVIGSPETVAREVANWAVESSVDGVCMALFDFEGDLELLAHRGLEVFGNSLADAGKSLVLTT